MVRILRRGLDGEDIQFGELRFASLLLANFAVLVVPSVLEIQLSVNQFIVCSDWDEDQYVKS